MGFETVKVKCAVCGWEGYITRETSKPNSFLELVEENKIFFGILNVEECPRCKYVSRDISKIEFPNIREIMRTIAYQSLVNFSATNEEDPKGYLRRTDFSKYAAYGFICEINAKYLLAANSYWKASELVFEGTNAYDCDENNNHDETNYLEIAKNQIKTREQDFQKQSIVLLEKVFNADKTNVEAFCELLVALAFSDEEKAQNLFPVAKNFISSPTTPKTVKTFLINKITEIEENINWTPEEE